MFKDNQFSLQPLAGMVEEIFDDLSDSEILDAMRMLGNTKLDNYTQGLISKLVE
jgi:hypothetical protein